MDSSIVKKAGKVLAKRNKYKRWQKAVTALGAVVVFVTAYALIMPALTMVKDTYCGLDEHEHTDECYQEVLVCGYEDVPEGEDSGTSGDVLPEGFVGVGEGTQDVESGSAAVMSAGHVHDDSCYEIVQTLVCGQEETEGYSHTHTDECYTVTEEIRELTCGQEESEGHEHTEDCYDENGEVICGQEASEGHGHSDECYKVVTEASRELTCGQEEGSEAGHTHVDGCYVIESILICGQEEGAAEALPDSGTADSESGLPEEEAPPAGREETGHVHTDDCYELELLCGQQAHTHIDWCYERPTWCGLSVHGHTEDCCDESGELICGQKRHAHTDECYIEREIYCGLEAHVHLDVCYDEENFLICEKQAHVHTELCYERPSWCGLLTHAHVEECYNRAGELICGQKVHEHTDSCFTEKQVWCGAEKHRHLEPCYDRDGELICGREEHFHTLDCYREPGISDEDWARVLNVNAMIEELPSMEEIGERLAALEDDDEAYAEYFESLSFQAGLASTHYEDLSGEPGKDLQRYVINPEYILQLSSLWEATALDMVTGNEYTVKAINRLGSEKTWALLYGDGKTVGQIGGGSAFTYWQGYVVEPDEKGMVITRILPYKVSHKDEKVPAGGFIVLIHGGDGGETIPSDKEIKTGDYVQVNFNYRNTSSGTSVQGFGTITIGELIQERIPAEKEPRNNELSPISGLPSTAGLIEINLYNYGNQINNRYLSNSGYPGFQNPGGTESIGNSLSPWGMNFGDNIVSDLEAGKASVTVKGGASINGTTNTDTASRPISMEQTVMAPELGEDGYPKLANGLSLDYLFSNSPADSVQRVNSSGLEGLFRYNETTGEYSFNSRENHAQYNPETNKFDLYDGLITSNFIMYPFGNFLPLNNVNTQTMRVSEIDREYFQMVANSAAFKAMDESESDAFRAKYQVLSSTLNRFIDIMDRTKGKDWGGLEAVNEYFRLASPGGNSAPFSDASQLANVYSIDYDEKTDFYFGMTMEMNFIQPENGLTGKDTNRDGTPDYPMVFKFTGDDDVWIYVDNKLFLDLSGIHRHVGGWIDFQRGIVTYYPFNPESGYINFDSDTPIKTVTFAELLGDSAEELLKKDANGNYTTFKDNSAHNLKFYYMERGSGSGVCRMTFNFPLLETNSLMVGKELSVDNMEVEELLGNPDFEFQVLEAKSNGGKPGDGEAEKLFVKAGTDYSVYKGYKTRLICQETDPLHTHTNDCYQSTCGQDTADGHIHTDVCYMDEFVRSSTTDENGIIRLKRGEYAVIPGISVVNNGYYVRELFDTSSIDQYASVTSSGQATTKREGITVGNRVVNGAESDVCHMLDGSTLFQVDNSVNTTKLGNLAVKKKVEGGAPADAEFAFSVDLDGELIPEGTAYYVGDEETIRQLLELKGMEERTEEQEDALNTLKEQLRRTSETGGVIRTKANQTAVLENILAGTKYIVQETPESSDGYTVTYEIKGNEDDKKAAVRTDDNGRQYVGGVVSIRQDTIELVVTNATEGTSLDIPVKKTLGNPDGTLRTYWFRLEQVADSSGTPLGASEAGVSQNVSVTYAAGEETQKSSSFLLLYPSASLTAGETVTYYYQIKELAEEPETENAGDVIPDEVTTVYDETEYIIEVAVSRDHSGDTQANITGVWEDGEKVDSAGGSFQAEFTNTLLKDLSVTKLAMGGDLENKQFLFDIQLYGNDSLPNGEYRVERQMANGSPADVPEGKITFVDGKAMNISLKAGETVTIKGLPYGIGWNVTEKSTDGYRVTHMIGSVPVTASENAAGEEAGAEAVSTLTSDTDHVTFINRTSYRLPESGGPGTMWYTIAGIGLVLMAGFLYRVRKFRKGGCISSKD